MTSEKGLYGETQLEEELQLGFEILNNRAFYFGPLFIACFCGGILHYFVLCILLFFFFIQMSDVFTTVFMSLWYKIFN